MAMSAERRSKFAALHPSACLSVRPSVCQPVRQSVSLSVSSSVRLSVSPSVCQWVRQSIRQSVRQSAFPSDSTSVFQWVRPSDRQSVHPSVCQWVRQSVHLSVSPSFSQPVSLGFCFLCFIFVSTIPLKPFSRIWWHFVVIKDISGRWAYSQEILINFVSGNYPPFELRNLYTNETVRQRNVSENLSTEFR